MAVEKFEVGVSYATRSMCDWDCIYNYEILARTEKTVTVTIHGETVQRRIVVRGDAESFRPFGTYSMCPTIYADEHARKLADAT